MTNEITIKATYSSNKKVPLIGQCKRMRVNGRFETLTLNNISIERRHFYGDGGSPSGFEFDSVERWGAYTDCDGW